MKLILKRSSLLLSSNEDLIILLREGKNCIIFVPVHT